MDLDKLAIHMKSALEVNCTDEEFLKVCRIYIQRAFDQGYDNGYAAEWEKIALEDSCEKETDCGKES